MLKDDELGVLYDIRWIALNRLWHSFPPDTSIEWKKESMRMGGVTEDEIEKLTEGE